MKEPKVVVTLLLLNLLLPIKLMAGIQSFSVDQLSEAGQRAYQTLLTANQFEGDAIGYAAQPSKLVEAYRLLLKESASDVAFKSLLERASPAGQLYALCGIYFTDHAFFLTKVEKNKLRSDHVRTQFGCIGGMMPASEIIQDKAPNVVRLSSPRQTIADWQKKNPDLSKKGYRLDIIGGGYPSEFSREYNSKWRRA